MARSSTCPSQTRIRPASSRSNTALGVAPQAGNGRHHGKRKPCPRCRGPHFACRCNSGLSRAGPQSERKDSVKTCVAARLPRRRRLLLLPLFGLAGLVLPGAATAQRGDDRAQFNARMNMLERSVAELSIQIERLRVSDQELERKLDAMRTNYDERLERLGKSAAPKTPPPGRSKP
jgi:hypothetical protein